MALHFKHGAVCHQWHTRHHPDTKPETTSHWGRTWGKAGVWGISLLNSPPSIVTGPGDIAPSFYVYVCIYWAFLRIAEPVGNEGVNKQTLQWRSNNFADRQTALEPVPNTGWADISENEAVRQLGVELLICWVTPFTERRLTPFSPSSFPKDGIMNPELPKKRPDWEPWPQGCPPSSAELRGWQSLSTKHAVHRRPSSQSCLCLAWDPLWLS